MDAMACRRRQACRPKNDLLLSAKIGFAGLWGDLPVHE
jgi:hypothetical protein